jgi:hypothetical protein
MKQIFIVYKTDTWHSYASRDIIGIATSQQSAIDICQQKAKKEHHKISDQEVWNLKNIMQSQGYSGEGEFQYEAVDVDTLF